MPSTSYEWAWGFGEAVCVTAVCGEDVQQVLRRFGGDPLAPTVPVQQDPEVGAEAEVSFVRCDGWLLGIEVNGFQGSRSEVLRSVSTATTAVSAFWNLTSGPSVTLAEHGHVRARVELHFDDTADVAGAEPQLAADLNALFDACRKERPEFTSVAMLEAMTGLSLQTVFGAELGPAHPLMPLLDDHPSWGMYSALKHDDPVLLDLIAAASPDDRRRLSEWAARQALVTALADDSILQPSQLPPSGQPLPSQLAERVRRLQHAAYEPQSWAGPDAYLPDHEGRGRRGWAARAVYANADPDDLTAAADTTRFAYLAAGADRALLTAARLVLLSRDR